MAAGRRSGDCGHLLVRPCRRFPQIVILGQTERIERGGALLLDHQSPAPAGAQPRRRIRRLVVLVVAVVAARGWNAADEAQSVAPAKAASSQRWGFILVVVRGRYNREQGKQHRRHGLLLCYYLYLQLANKRSNVMTYQA